MPGDISLRATGTEPGEPAEAMDHNEKIDGVDADVEARVEQEDPADVSVRCGTGGERAKSKCKLKLEKALEAEKGYFSKKLAKFVGKHDAVVDGLEERIAHIAVKTAGRFAKTKVNGGDDQVMERYEAALKTHMEKEGGRVLERNFSLASSKEQATPPGSETRVKVGDSQEDDDDKESEGTPKTLEDNVDEVLRWTVKVSSVVKEMTSAVGSVVGTVCDAVTDVGQTIKKLKE